MLDLFRTAPFDPLMLAAPYNNDPATSWNGDPYILGLNRLDWHSTAFMKLKFLKQQLNPHRELHKLKKGVCKKANPTQDALTPELQVLSF
ncbi:hypothetical protein KIN20_026256 [Parelaphostrongylus tenuis]|uniref:Uncharacterized protein n=1 Tax=Parelaphostrongylus tenuis TaxID=148309 RepID=A0AAD5QXW4_PARTN|nr:hypothetical protein KIN20_026256 [Parelaphostrongylus tenuis]